MQRIIIKMFTWFIMFNIFQSCDSVFGTSNPIRFISSSFYGWSSSMNFCAYSKLIDIDCHSITIVNNVFKDQRTSLPLQYCCDLKTFYNSSRRLIKFFLLRWKIFLVTHWLMNTIAFINSSWWTFIPSGHVIIDASHLSSRVWKFL